MMKKLRGTLAVLAVIVLVLSLGVTSTGCIGGSDASKEWVRVVPGDSIAVVYVDAAILEDETTKSLMETFGYDDKYEEFLEEIEDSTDVDPSDVDWGVFILNDVDYDEYGDIETMDFAIYIQGKFDVDDLIEKITESEELEESKYKGITIYKGEDYDGTRYGIVVERDYVIIGTLSMVKDIIDVKKGDAEYDKDLSGIAGKVGNGYIVAIANYEKMPSKVKNEVDRAVQNAPTVPIVSLLPDFEYVAMVYTPKGKDALYLKSVVHFENEDSADDMAKIINGSLATVKSMGFVKENENLKKLFEESITVTRNGKDVVVTIEASVDLISEIIDKLNSPYMYYTYETNNENRDQVTKEAEEEIEKELEDLING